MACIFSARTALRSGIVLCGAGLSTFAQAQTAAAPDADQSIVVTAQRQAYIGDIPIKDMPQNVQTIGSARLKELNITRLDMALDLVSGVSHLNNFGGLWDSYAIRGFAGDSNNVPTGVLVNGFNAGRGFSGPRDTSSVERIEVLKGPTSALFGRGEPGGTVNLVTKKPEFTSKGSLTLQGGSFNSYRIEGDYTTPLTDTIAVRINGAYDDAKSYRDTIHTKKTFITPSILWRPDSATSLSYELEYGKQEIPFDRGIPIYQNDFKRLPSSRYLGEPGDGPMRIDVLGHQLQLQHDFNDNWSFLAGGSYRTTELAGTGEYPELVASRQPFLSNGTLLSRQRRYADSKSQSFIGRGEVTGKFDVGGMSNTLVIGADYDFFRFDQFQSRFRPPVYNATLTMAQINGINVFNPVYGAYALPDAGASLVYNRLERDNSAGVYGYDQVSLTDWLKVRVGGRYDNFRQSILNRASGVISRQHPTAFSPQTGIVIEPSKSVSFYGSYGKGFRPNNGLDFFGNPFAPERSKSYEIGVKYVSADKRISGSVTIYQMDKSNILTSDPNPAHSGFVIAVGSARSRGVEVDFNARLPYGFNLLLAYAYTDAYWRSAVRDPDFGLQIQPGDPLINISKNSGNLLLTNSFNAFGKHATVGGGVQYIDRRLGETAANYYLPSAKLVKLLGNVDVTPHINVSAQIDNLFNVRWFANSYSALWTYPGAPRSFRISATYHL